MAGARRSSRNSAYPYFLFGGSVQQSCTAILMSTLPSGDIFLPGQRPPALGWQKSGGRSVHSGASQHFRAIENKLLSASPSPLCSCLESGRPETLPCEHTLALRSPHLVWAVTAVQHVLIRTRKSNESSWFSLLLGSTKKKPSKPSFGAPAAHVSKVSVLSRHSCRSQQVSRSPV